ncbi:carbohydrate ABC transporter membrane protein 1, CUT1 family [Gracilibacillus ureilyticus]|uniref:Carbohydrate ABC transporter membrane protein 1, CUT1 family n=1 Tax=Gracilibacillus ureilyticus TaxID=531814 RepID=A0A1H9Q2R6_9BACI|nr:sugar ABC transporter permease [Gracilibacillus ureilyticus]SER54720.1 carbohydrate ABC transporter membrane protein 1, CUT1 family [Gracilibacillus ureilyticus]
MKKLGKFQLNEKQLGYAMILPSLILVFVVTLWPVAQSFYNSLFDYRLNDPTRSQKMLNATIDLERYADNYFYIEGQLSNLESNADGEVSAAVEQVREVVDSYHGELISNSEISEKIKQIDEMLMNYQPVTDENLKYTEVDNDFAKEYRSALQESAVEFQTIADSTENEQLAQSLSQTSSLLTATSENILESNFIGFANYGKYLKDQRMWQSLGNTVYFTVVSVSFELILGLAIALLINRAFRGRGLVRASVLIPWAIPTAVAAMMWGFLYDGQSGIIGHYFEQIGIISDASWLLSTSSGGLFSVIFADVWKTTPYMALLLLAGLQTIPRSLYEASDVDGANRFQQFIKITLPLLKSSILVALLFRTLDAFRVFDLIYVLTGGGPANATESISIYAYKTLFSQQNFGEGSVLSVIVFLCVALISFIYVRLIGSDLFAGRMK